MSFGTKASGDDATSAWANLIEAALGNGYPLKAAGYLVFYNTTESQYEAHNGIDGTVDHTGTNAATVINSAIDSCPRYGVVYVHGGTDGVPITEQITVDQYKSLFFDFIKISDTDDDGIVIDGGASISHMYNFIIGRKLRWPESYAKSAVKIRNTHDVYVNIRGLAIESGSPAANSIGIHLIGDGAGCHFNTVNVNSLIGAETGIQLESTSGTDWCNANKIYNADIVNMTYGTRLVNGGNQTAYNTFTNVTVNDGGDGTYGFYNVDDGNIYLACRTINFSGTAIDFYNDATGDTWLLGCLLGNSTVTNNGTLKHTLCNYAGTGKLENEGAAANVNDGGTIAHGLATTPTWSQVTGTVAGEMVDVTGMDAANLTVAIKTHAGAAGTQQTIYWKAKKEF